MKRNAVLITSYWNKSSSTEGRFVCLLAFSVSENDSNKLIWRDLVIEIRNNIPSTHTHYGSHKNGYPLDESVKFSAVLSGCALCQWKEWNWRESHLGKNNTFSFFVIYFVSIQQWIMTKHYLLTHWPSVCYAMWTDERKLMSPFISTHILSVPERRLNGKARMEQNCG